MADADKKTCSKCDELKPASDFRIRKDRRRKDYASGTCRTCEASYYRNRIKRKRESPAWVYARWAVNLKSKYGLSREAYIEKMLDQDFCCPICEKPQVAWIVDHDHVCCNREGSCGNCIRGLLCKSCNTLLGAAKDDRKALANAINYLGVSDGQNL